MSRLRDYAQLVRLPNHPTACADIILGALATETLPERWLVLVPLLFSSVSLYAAGMVWNDFFDVQQDLAERPNRPIPSGRVSQREAAQIGVVLIILGLAFALVAGLVPMTFGEEVSLLSLQLTLPLIACILLYDGWLKRTWLGPVAMGGCRFFNVLLGISIIGNLDVPRGPLLSAIVGLYIVGVTWFARTEPRRSNRMALRGAAGLMLLALLLALPLPFAGDPDASSVLFPYMLALLGFLVGLPIVQAIRDPVPRNVQFGVKRAIFGLIFLDAVLASACAGLAGFAILGLLIPSLYLGRMNWLYAT